MKIPFLLFWAFATLAYGQSRPANEFHLDKEYPVSLGGSLRLRSSDAHVVITGSNRTTARVKVDRVVTTRGLGMSNHVFSVEVIEKDGDLTIQEKASGTHWFVMGSYQEEYTIHIEIPLGMALDIDGDDGSYQINSIHGTIRLEASDADVALTGCLGNIFSFRLDDGDLTMDGGAGQLSLVGGDGDLRIANARFSSADVRLDDGSLVMETALADNGHYDLDVQDGLLALTILSGGGHIRVRHDDARVIANGRFETLEQTESHTALKTGVGTADVRIQAGDGRVRLQRS